MKFLRKRFLALHIFTHGLFVAGVVLIAAYRAPLAGLLFIFISVATTRRRRWAAWFGWGVIVLTALLFRSQLGWGWLMLFTAAALIGSPSLLQKKDGYPPLLCLSALESTEGPFFYHFESYGQDLTFNRRSYLGAVAEYWSGGLSAIQELS